MKEKRLKLVTDAQAILLGENVTDEQRAQASTMMADVATLEKDIDDLERLARAEADLRSTTRPPQPNPGAEGSEEALREQRERQAFERYIRFGKDELTAEERTVLRERRDVGAGRSGGGMIVPRSVARRGKEQRDITTTGANSTVSGATMTPQLFLPTMIDAQKAYGNIATAVRLKVTDNNGAPIKVAMSNDTGNTLTTLTAETTVVAEQDPAFSGFVISTDTVATLVKISVQELEDNYFDLDEWITKKFGLRYVRGLEYLLTNGNGSNVASVVAGATLAHTTAASGSFPVYGDFTATYGALDPAYLPGAKWAMSQATRVYLMSLLDNYGRPLFIPSPNSGTLDQILGLPILLNQQLPPANVAGNTGILLGDFEEGYMLRTDGELSIRRLDERYMDALEVGFIAYARLGGASTDAGTHPILKMATHA
jgi:HK97 family phage major capsid protein